MAQLQTPAKITRQTIGSGIFFRVERQTLQRIQDTQDALFTIRIYNTPLQEVAQDPIRARLLSRHISTMSNDFKSYKSILKYEDLLQEYLCRHF
ncbi:heme-dependent oxidative N-demethylase subunit alpha family protein [Sneathiella glossodoripedis]|uniref:heme-dependent oxidative N-demethylase subunit alpha family protein n=1 Tax=Sneathiella glossodoripedis TaxID=418853 RepID=UPI00131EEE67